MDPMYTIPAAIGLGALHSLEPGHGKGVITAYLISSRAKIKDAILLGILSAIAHTISIVILAFAASSTVKMFVPEHLIQWVQLVSGIAITYLGARILYQKIHPPVVVVGTIGHIHSESCSHHHRHSRHKHGMPASLPKLFSIGFFTGLIPCPSALAVLLAAITADQIPFGLGLAAAFSTGSAIAMSTLGVLVVQASDAVEHLEKWRVADTLSSVSSVLIIGLGGFIVYQSLKNFGIL